MVGNRSAVGEQYVELQPQADSEPYLTDDSEIATENTRTPIKVETLLTNLSNTVESVDKKALKTTVTEMGKAFEGTGQDLGRIIDSGNSFIEDANENFDVTTALIRDSNTVLDWTARQGQRDPDLRQEPPAVQLDAGRVRRRPAQGHRQRLGDRHRAAHASSRTTRSSSASSSAGW